MFGLYILAAMILAGAIALVAFYHQKSLKMTSIATGQIVSSRQREIRDEKERRDETVIQLRYAVAGREYSLEQVLRGRQAARFPTGRSLRVYYNPADPQMSRIDVR